jgi:DNA invertase Pin-like site-specific DNA recombinase
MCAALESFKALGIDFVSYSEQMDTSTPAGKIVFTVLGAVAELERSLIVERVRAGLRNARAKGKRLGRPRAALDAARIGRLRAQGRSIREIADELGYSRSLVHKSLANCESGRVASAASLVSSGRKPVSKTDDFHTIPADSTVTRIVEG